MTHPVAETHARLAEAPETRDLIRYATLGANSHNTQPWRFKASEGTIQILPDYARRIPVVDPDDHHIFASLGCAAENLAIAAGERGKAGELSLNGTDVGSITFTPGSGSLSQGALFDAVPLRQSTRTNYDGRTASAADIAALGQSIMLQLRRRAVWRSMRREGTNWTRQRSIS
jgi:hypothetical protein